MMNVRQQLQVLATFVGVIALLIFLVSAFDLVQAPPGVPIEPPPISASPWEVGLINAGIVVLLYGALGAIGLWFARRLDLPGVFRANSDRRDRFFKPLFIGLATGALLVILELFFVHVLGIRPFDHPEFPISLIASATASIGEEIVFRMFVMGLWAFLLNLLLRRWGARTAALWIANVLGALAFGAAHLPAAMLILDVSSPAQIPFWVLFEIFLLNGILGLVAGVRYVRDGLVAAIGVHFWADIVLHVLAPAAL